MGFFKAYDMRGAFGVDFDEDTVYRVGRWLPSVVGARRVLVGRDARLTSAALRDALCRGLTASGCAVDDLGLATTPMVYFLTALDGYDASVQITASHNPASHNGLKVSRAGAVPVGYATGLAELEARVRSGALPPAAPAGAVSPVDGRARFVDWLRARRPDLSGLRLAVDCSDGMAGLVARDLLGEEPLYLNAVPDGRFPGHSPNPLEARSREQVVAAVRAGGLDAGVIFDGDADRVMFVDETGAFVPPDALIPLLAGIFLAREPGAAVIHDVRTSRGVIEALREAGARPVMGKVGHAFAKVLLRESGAVCGGELAGHYYFRDFFCCDSGEFAALLALGAVAAAKRRGVRFSELLAPVLRYANSGELNFRVREPAAAVAAARAALAPFGAPLGESGVDGVRVEYADWWFNLRVSNTEPYLRLVVEASDAAALAARLAALRGALAPFADAPAGAGGEGGGHA